MAFITRFLGVASLVSIAAAAQAQTITVATVNNGDMVRMQELAGEFTKANPDISVNWVTLEENILRERVTTDIATGGGQYDVLTIGTYETPIWAKQGWLNELTFPESYDVDDLLKPIREGLSVDGKLYAAPFYGEAAFVMYRTDLFEKAGLTMPEQPNWDFIADAARKLTDRANGINGICLRGKAGWGENMAILGSMNNAFGGSWFDMNWNPQFDQQSWKDMLTFYVGLMKDAGPEGASSNGFTENLALFQQGKCGMWIDATVAGSFVSDPTASQVAGNVGFAMAPDAGHGKVSSWLWAWSLAIPSSSKHAEAAQKFIAWATSKEYIAAVAAKDGLANVPPGTRTSLYENQEYLAAAPFAKYTIASINAMDPVHPTVNPVPYVGVQFVAIPEFQGLGTQVGQLFSAALAGQSTVDDALAQAQSVAVRTMTRAGYIK